MIDAFGILVLIIALILHEAGHAVAMTRRGVEIKAVGLGLPFSKKLRLTLRSRFLPYPFVITPFLLGAYVQPTEKGMEQLKQLSYKDQAVCYTAGIIVNIVSGALVLGVVAMMYQVTGYDEWGRAGWIAVIAGVTALVFVVFRRAVSQILPLLSVTVLVLLVYLLVGSLNSVGGPVAVVEMVTSGSDIRESLWVGGIMSLNLAFLNMLPIVPLDGGRVISSYLDTRGKKRVSVAFQGSTALVALVLFSFVIVSDFV